MFKYVAALALLFGLLVSSPAHSATPIQNGYFINLNTVKFIQCVTTEGDHFAGTGWIVGKDRLVTANHVIYGAISCSVDHKPVSLISHSEELDIAVLKVDLGDKPPVLEVSCEGFVLGNTYLSLGYSKATDFAMTKLMAEGSFDDMMGEAGPIKHLAELKGLMFKGMSGGPILDMDGRVVGLNTGSDEDGSGLSRSLSETALCAALAAPAAPLYPMPPKKVMIINLDDILKGGGPLLTLPPPPKK